MICNSWFLLEGTSKIIAFGLCLDRGSFMQEVWSALDFSYVCTYFISLGLTSHNPIITIILTLKYLRPIKLVSMF